jgi:uracil-DNA glycosylase family protein
MTAARAPHARDAISRVRDEAATCTACELYRIATQTVFGEGPPDAKVMLVGEQPGDREDLSGHPFVGPAGQILDTALNQAHIDRDTVYVTNAVKHFRNEPRGKKRIHRKPALAHIRACEPWLTAEISIVQPEVIVAMGATAVQALLSPSIKVMADRGRVFETAGGSPTLVTIHPSSILRTRDRDDRATQMDAFVSDLAHVHELAR